MRRQMRKREINSPRVNQKWNRLFSAPFSDEEFQRALQKLSRGKSAGPNGILLEFILELGSKAKQTILLFINKTWGGSFPSYWRKAGVLLILKPKKDPTDIQSFRPISLTCILSKLSERMIIDRLQYYTWTAAVIFLRNRLASDGVTIRLNKLFA
ncbi:putative RNA-directed DNA polymerase from transposon BS [Trichonephila clavipes]|nr:putative RNA-directed DNA polymerase from transposon BS [Trichonephila clavipes]